MKFDFVETLTLGRTFWGQSQRSTSMSYLMKNSNPTIWA